MSTAIATSKILIEIANKTGQDLPADANKFPSYMRNVRKLITSDQWNEVSEEAQGYLSEVNKAVASKKQIPFPPDLDGKAAAPKTQAKVTLSDLKQQARENMEAIKTAKAQKKQEQAEIKKELKKVEREQAKNRKEVEADVEEEIEILEEIPEDLDCESETKPYNIASLIELYNRGRIKLPRFQRKDCWTKAERQKFLESALKSFPIPSIMISRTGKDEEWSLLDGKQRVTTLMMFANNLEQAFGKNYANMSKKLQDKFMLTTIPVVEVTTARKNWRFIFQRINQAGKPLNDIEIRRAAYENALMDALEDFSEYHEVWKSLFGANIRFKGFSALLRALAMHYSYKEYTKGVAKFMDGFCESVEPLIADQTIVVPDLQQNLHRAMTCLNAVFEEQQSKARKQIFRVTEASQVNLGLVDVLIHASLNLIENIPSASNEEITAILKTVRERFCAPHTEERTNPYLVMITQDTSGTENINNRMSHVDSWTLP